MIGLMVVLLTSFSRMVWYCFSSMGSWCYSRENLLLKTNNGGGVRGGQKA